jgi:3-demethoxyubiquinol 3-hydroxylase
MKVDSSNGVDRAIMAFDRMLRILSGGDLPHGRVSPAEQEPEAPLSEAQKKHSAGLMRINHAGEVCAQALYEGQALTSRSAHLKAKLGQAQQEEIDHLAWCAQRLGELDSHASWLNPLWYGGSLGLGMLAGLMGDAWNLGFLAETERQVEAHLHGHLDVLVEEDKRSAAILTQMAIDEGNHAHMAEYHGAKALPTPVKGVMKCLAAGMKRIVYHI